MVLWRGRTMGRPTDQNAMLQCRDRASERAKDTVCNNIHVDLQTSLKGRLERKGYSRSTCTVLGKSFTHHTATPPLAIIDSTCLHQELKRQVKPFLRIASVQILEDQQCALLWCLLHLKGQHRPEPISKAIQSDLWAPS